MKNKDNLVENLQGLYLAMHEIANLKDKLDHDLTTLEDSGASAPPHHTIEHVGWIVGEVASWHSYMNRWIAKCVGCVAESQKWPM